MSDKTIILIALDMAICEAQKGVNFYAGKYSEDDKEQMLAHYQERLADFKRLERKLSK